MIHPGCDSHFESPIFDLSGGVILGRDKQRLSRLRQILPAPLEGSRSTAISSAQGDARRRYTSEAVPSRMVAAGYTGNRPLKYFSCQLQ